MPSSDYSFEVKFIAILSELFTGCRLLPQRLLHAGVSYAVITVTVVGLALQFMAHLLFFASIRRRRNIESTALILTKIVSNVLGVLAYLVAVFTLNKHAPSIRRVFSIFADYNRPRCSTMLLTLTFVAAVGLGLQGGIVNFTRELNRVRPSQSVVHRIGRLNRSIFSSISLIPFCGVMLVGRDLLIALDVRIRRCRQHSKHFLISRRLSHDIVDYLDGVVALNSVFAVPFMCWLVQTVIGVPTMCSFLLDLVIYALTDEVVDLTFNKVMDMVRWTFEVAVALICLSGATSSYAQCDLVEHEVFWGGRRCPKEFRLEFDILMDLVMKRYAITVFNVAPVTRGFLLGLLATSTAYVLVGLQLDPRISRRFALIERVLKN